MIELGGNISLVGFKDFDGGVLIVVKNLWAIMGKSFLKYVRSLRILQ